ncbi:MAG: lytic transglycosylase domain-containing protein [Xanthomonadales bacterium]|nr:lytic transglycosylase domain-containing protein [Xanthomonadales bacterium]
MSKQSLRLMVVLLTGLLSASSFAQVYKYTDKNGVIFYTNVKPSGRKVSILTFPCYVGEVKCRQISWEKVRLNTSKYAEIINKAAIASSVEPALIRAIIHAESAFNPKAESPKGAQGLMQLMPFNHKHLGVSNPFLPEQNIPGGAAHLAELKTQFDDIDLVIAAYNAGAGAVRKYNGVPPFNETREYLRRVKILYRRYGQAM